MRPRTGGLGLILRDALRAPQDEEAESHKNEILQGMFNDDQVGAPLKQKVFRRIWLASLLSNFGSLIQGVGAAWAMTQMTTAADMVALVQTASTLPIMLISIPAGAVADMYDRRIVGLVALFITLIG